jgi:hypothetical protein
VWALQSLKLGGRFLGDRPRLLVHGGVSPFLNLKSLSLSAVARLCIHRAGPPTWPHTAHKEQIAPSSKVVCSRHEHGNVGVAIASGAVYTVIGCGRRKLEFVGRRRGGRERPRIRRRGGKEPSVTRTEQGNQGRKDCPDNANRNARSSGGEPGTQRQPHVVPSASGPHIPGAAAPAHATAISRLHNLICQP